MTLLLKDHLQISFLILSEFSEFTSIITPEIIRKHIEENKS